MDRDWDHPRRDRPAGSAGGRDRPAARSGRRQRGRQRGGAAPDRPARRRRAAADPPLTLLHTVVFYPAEIVNAAAGFAYGFFPALALMTVGWVLSGLICWAIGHRVARPLLDRWFGAERFERVERAIERGGPTLLLAMRLIPILPFSIVSYAAGAARVPALALHLDDRARLPPDHRDRRLLRHQARGPLADRPAGLGQCPGAAGAARHRPLGRAPSGTPLRRALRRRA